MIFFTELAYVVKQEFSLLWRHPRMLVAVAVVALLPALYAAIYLTSVWDPAAHTRAMRVAVVNLDEGTDYRGHRFNMGAEVIARLARNDRLGYVNYAHAEQARHDVRLGRAAFALVIPQDFSSNAIPGALPGGGKLVVYASEGNSFQTASIAKQFANELGHEVNESLNTRRWALVLSTAAGSQRSVDQLQQGLHRARDGAQELVAGTAQAASAGRSVSQGAARLQGGVTQWTDGFKQLGTGLRTLDAKRPRNAELTTLKNGADALANGHSELSAGLQELQTGSHQLREGVSGFKAEAADSLLLSSSIKDGIGQLSVSVASLDDGVREAAEGQQKLSEGANKLSVGVGTLTQGVRAMNGAIHQAVVRLPEDSQLDELAAGSSQLSTGAGALADGLHKLRSGMRALLGGLDLLVLSMPASVDAPEGSPEGLAHSVKPSMEIDAPVGNSGSGFAPNILPAALWLGAGLAAFLVHIRAMPRHAKRFSAPAKFIGKACLPATVVMLQAGALALAVQWGLHIQVFHSAAFMACLAVAGISFLMIVLFLTRALGDAGKVCAMVFLAVQLSASGGILPVELSGGIYEMISPWLPMTWTVHALKAAMFGAYEGVWQTPLLWVSGCGLASLLLAIWVGRWRYVHPAQMRPAVGN